MEDDDILPEYGSKRDWWKRGRALDLWSIPHFLFGILAALVPPLWGAPVLTVFVLMLALALTWEFYEKLVGIKETPLNSVFDVILPAVAFTLTSFLTRMYPLHPQDLAVIMIATFLLYAFTNLSGWLAYRRRKREFFP